MRGVADTARAATQFKELQGSTPPSPVSTSHSPLSDYSQLDGESRDLGLSSSTAEAGSQTADTDDDTSIKIARASSCASVIISAAKECLATRTTDCSLRVSQQGSDR